MFGGGRFFSGDVAQSGKNLETRFQTGGAGGVLFLEEARKNSARDAHRGFHALGVAAEPKQIVGDAAGKIEGGAADIERMSGRTQQREGRRGSIAQHPGILAAAAALDGHHHAVERSGDARQTARHHGIASARGHGIHTNHHVARMERTILPHRHGGKRDALLRDITAGFSAHSIEQRLAFLGV